MFRAGRATSGPLPVGYERASRFIVAVIVVALRPRATAPLVHEPTDAVGDPPVGLAGRSLVDQGGSDIVVAHAGLRVGGAGPRVQFFPDLSSSSEPRSGSPVVPRPCHCGR